MTNLSGNPLPAPVAHIFELVKRLSAAEKDLANTLGAGTDAVIDSHGHAHLLREAQAALQQSENRFRTLIEKSTDVIAMLAADGTVLYDSPSVTSTLGYAPAELVRQSAFKFLHPEDLARTKETFSQLCATPRQSSTVTLRYRHKNGSYRWFEATGTNLLEEPGVNAVVINYRDITERTAAEAALRESQSRLNFALESNAIGAWELSLVDQTARRTLLHDRIFGYEKFAGNWTYQTFLEHVLPEDRPEVDRSFRAATAAQSNWNFECRIRRTDGAVRWILGAGGQERNEEGKPVGMSGLVQDITERKQTQLALLASETRYRTMLQGVSAGVVVHAADMRITAFNAKATELLGLTDAQMFARSPSEPQWARIDIDSRPIPDAELPYRRAFRTRQPVRNAILGIPRPGHPDLVWMLVDANPILTAEGAIAEVIVTFMDVTAQIRAEQAVRESATFTADVLNSLTAHVVVLDEHVKIIATNEAWRRFAAEDLTVLGNDAFLGKDYVGVCGAKIRRYQEQDAEIARAGIRDVLAGTKPTFTHEYPCSSATRQDWFQLRVSALTGARRGVVVAHENITERRNAQLEVQRQAAFAHFNPNPVMELSASGEVMYFNTAADQMAHTLGGHHPAQILPPNTAAIVRDCLATAKPLLRLETQARQRTISWSFFPVALNQVVHCYAGDITERKRLDEHLRQSQKMEAVGQLSGGVAHDFNNLLTVIQGHVGLVEAMGDVPPSIAESLREIAHAAERAGALTRQLLTFSREQVMQLRDLDANEVVKNMSKMLRRVLREDIALELRYAPAPLAIHADAGMIEQILMNLVVNARDAMPGGGPLVIELTHVEFTAETAKKHPHTRAGRFVRLAVSDRGTGIPPAVLAKIFEPFFTTKEIGKGTGLGLANVYGIVQQHEGWVDVDTEVGHGTTFAVYLPQPDMATPAVAPDLLAPGLAGGTETILIVEDEPLVRLVVETLLTRQGYRVLTAAAGPAALELWQQHRADIRLLLTDLVMPHGISGRQLAERLKGEQPDLSVIYTSGYSAETADKNFILEEGVNFLTKPFEAARLTSAVRAMLDARRSRTPFAPRSP